MAHKILGHVIRYKNHPNYKGLDCYLGRDMSKNASLDSAAVFKSADVANTASEAMDLKTPPDEAHLPGEACPIFSVLQVGEPGDENMLMQLCEQIASSHKLK